MTALSTRSLSRQTWPDFARLVEAHNGIWGGCWCLEFHERLKGSPQERRARKEARVAAGEAHAALVYDGEACVGWAQFGSPAELPCIKNRKAYDAGLSALPDWRITCLFVAKTHRKTGVAEAAVTHALADIAQAGGGCVEAYPEDVTGRKVSSSFLWGGTTSMFESLGFSRGRQIGKHKWVYARTIAPTP